MKIKGLTKLALSGVALAAVAATLGTSTYAWYVTNSTATAKGASGMASANGGGSVLLAQNLASNETVTDANHGHTAFAPNIEFTDANMTMDVNGLVPTTPREYALTSDTALVTGKKYYTRSAQAPYTYTEVASPAVANIGTYYEKGAAQATAIDANTTWHNNKGAESTTGKYLTFDLWVFSSEVSKINMTYGFVNTSTDNEINSQIAYATDGSPVEYGNTFIKNIEHSLRMAYNQTNYVKTETNSVTYTQVTGEYVAGTQYYVRNGYAETTVADATDFANRKSKLYIRSAAEPYTYTVQTTGTYDEDATYYQEKYDYADIEEFEDNVTYYTRSTSKTQSFDAGSLYGTTKFINVSQSASKTKSTAPYIETYDFVAANNGASGAGNAHTYYNAVVGNDPVYTTEAYSDATGAQQLTVVPGQETKLTFYVWIEGTDTDCFDSIQGQTFALNFKFEAVEE